MTCGCKTAYDLGLPPPWVAGRKLCVFDRVFYYVALPPCLRLPGHGVRFAGSFEPFAALLSA